MCAKRIFLPEFLYKQLSLAMPSDASALTSILLNVSRASKEIAKMTAEGALGERLGNLNSTNVQGETQKKLDVLANDAILEHCTWDGYLSGLVSEEMDNPYVLSGAENGSYLLLFDPLDGSSNIDVNVSIGTIFSVLKQRSSGEPSIESYFQAGRQQLAAGYALYGFSTLFVLSVGQGTHGFTLDHAIGEFVLTHPYLKVPCHASEFAINASNQRFWQQPIARYVTECQQGSAGIRGRMFNMRWVASMVADVHRILVRGGVFMYPQDNKNPAQSHGRLRLLYEASPMAFLIEQAGGAASTGRGALLDVIPESLHQRIPVVLGSREEVDLIERYHREYDNT